MRMFTESETSLATQAHDKSTHPVVILQTRHDGILDGIRVHVRIGEL